MLASFLYELTLVVCCLLSPQRGMFGFTVQCRLITGQFWGFRQFRSMWSWNLSGFLFCYCCGVSSWNDPIHLALRPVPIFRDSTLLSCRLSDFGCSKAQHVAIKVLMPLGLFRHFRVVSSKHRRIGASARSIARGFVCFCFCSP